MNNIEWSDEVLPDIEQALEAWVEPPEFAPPVPAGKYVGHVDTIREETQKIVEGLGKRWYATFDIRIIGGEQDERTVTFVRVDNVERLRKATGTMASKGLDLMKAASITAPLKTNKDFHEALLRMKEMGPAVKFGFQVDWRGFCSNCYESQLMRATGAATAEAAKSLSTPQQRGSAADFATKAKNYTKFPDSMNGKGKQDSFICNDCKETVRASMNVTRFIRPAF